MTVTDLIDCTMYSMQPRFDWTSVPSTSTNIIYCHDNVTVALHFENVNHMFQEIAHCGSEYIEFDDCKLIDTELNHLQICQPGNQDS
jgi:hypothetical protein